MSITEYAIHNPLFEGISEDNLQTILACTKASLCHYEKGETISWYGSPHKRIGIVQSGTVTIARNDEFGNRFILATIKSPGIFGLSVTLADINYDDIYICAATVSEALMLDSDKIMHGCERNCPCHIQLMKNLITIIATKNMMLVRKQCHMSCKSLRKKIMSYLLEQSQIHNSHEFYIEMNRQELAEYLGIDRTALSAELSRMKKEHILDFSHNHFLINDTNKSKDIFE